jgi:molybdopterin converting factor small subunit
MPLVHIPALLLSLTGGVREQKVSGKTVRDLIEQLDGLHPGIRERLLDGERLRSGLAIFVDGLVRREGLDFEVLPDSEIYFIPAVAGGSPVQYSGAPARGLSSQGPSG